jgi:bifunctional non-homologous end joining protein LigD
VGLRALLYSGTDGIRLVSRNGNTFKRFTSLCEGLARDLKGRRCVLDGEIVCLNPDGKPQFRDLLFRRAEPLFYAFDILWDEHANTDDEQENQRFRNGEDLRYAPLIDRKLRLHAVVAEERRPSSLLRSHRRRWRRLFRLAREQDLEGIVAKCKGDPYLLEHATWLKFAITTTRSGLDARSYSSASAEAIPVFRSGMDALWRARLHNGEIVMMNRGSEAESHG